MNRLKIRRPQGRGGSSPPLGTTFESRYTACGWPIQAVFGLSGQVA